MTGIYQQQINQGRILALLPDHKAKVKKAFADITHALSICNNPYVSLSWGKQSVVLMHLVYTVNPGIQAVFWRGEETNIINDFDDVIRQFIGKFPINYKEEFCKHSFKEQARKWTYDNNKDLLFMGLVKSESKGRKKTLELGDEHNIFIYKSGLKRSCPLHDWDNDDIAAYHALHDLPVLSTYRKYGFDARTSARINFGRGSFTERGMDYLTSEQQHQLRMLKK